MANKRTSIKTSGQRRMVFKSLIYAGLEKKIKLFRAQKQQKPVTVATYCHKKEDRTMTKYRVRPEEYSGVRDEIGGNRVMS